MEKKAKKKIFTVITLSMVLWIYSHDHKYSSNYEVLDDIAYARYENGNIYIGNEEYINSLIDISEYDILVVDERNSSDPNFKIINSYRITDKDTRNDIICAICDYNSEYPCDYYRSVESMRLEWFIHNVSYNLHYEVDRSRDVDFEISEEDDYDSKVLSKLFKL
nr:hypothetical protein [Bacilli bacterium]